MNNTSSRSLAVFAALLTMAANSHAQFLNGHLLTARIVSQGVEYPGYTTNFVVNSTPGAVEFSTYGPGTLRIDLFDVDSTHASILFSDFGDLFGPSPNLIVISDDSGTVADFADVALGDINWPGVDSSRVSFTPNSVSFDLGDLSGPVGVSTRLDIVAVPEPSSAILGLLGLGLALTGRRKGR